MVTSVSTIEVPIKASFREGLTVAEYFISTHGARKGGADTALRTADSGYLTRKLHDVAHEVVVRDVDCGTTDYSTVLLGATDERSGEWRSRKASEIEMSIYGRTLAADIEIDGQTIAEDHMLSLEDVKLIIQHAKVIGEVFVRTPFNCKVKSGVCQKCYGYDLSQAKPVSMGEAVGVVAAQSIGEPGTQLTMRTFHIGGAASRAAVASSVDAKSDGSVGFNATPSAAAMSADASSRDLVSTLAEGYASAGWGGAAGPYAARGNLTGLNANVRVTAGAAFWNLLAGTEVNVEAGAGATLASKFGALVSQTANDRVRGTYDDVALNFANQSGASRWGCGICFGNSFAQWPVADTGTLIGAVAATRTAPTVSPAALNGVDFRGVAFGAGG